MSDEAVLDERCDVLASVWAVWSQTVDGLTDDQWHRPSRLPAWDVAGVVAHHSRFPAALQTMVSRRVDGAPSLPSAAALLRYFNQPDGLATTLSGAVAEQANDLAGTAARADLVRCFAIGGPAALDTVRAAGPIVVDYFGHGTIALTEVLLMVGLEATVHLLDAQDALGMAPTVPEAALVQNAVLLAQVADPLVFVEGATGRREVNPFPLIR